MKRKVLVIFIHFLVWFAFLLIPYILNPDINPSLGSDAFYHKESLPLTHEGIIFDVLMPFRLANGLLWVIIFYTNHFWIMPLYQRQRSYLPLIVTFFISFSLLLLINKFIYPYATLHSEFKIGPPYNIFMFLIVWTASYMIALYEYIRRTESERLNAEVSLLKAQINPHFLFNTLNSIYSLSLKNADTTSDAIVKLSSIMRYSITEAKHSYVPLSKEIDYVTNYISLQRLRISPNVKLSYSVEGDTDDKEIAPMLLITFVENAFKYGVNPEENSEIDIKIIIRNTALEFYARNRKVFVSADENDRAGMGISNTRHRLQLLYNGKHTLDIRDGESDYIVDLKIRLI